MSSFYIPKYNCIFIHIPKTGGLSIRKGFFEKDYIGPFFNRVPRKYRECFSFAFVRNPYERLISAFSMFNRGPKPLISINFTDFLNIVVDESISYRGANPRKTPKQSIRHHTLPQTHPSNLLHAAKFIGRFESLEDDFKTICNTINAEFKELPQINASQHTTNYKDYFNQEQLNTINNFFANDFKELRYPLMTSI
jgi:hypothetical protein